jgi:hypothetical protein
MDVDLVIEVCCSTEMAIGQFQFLSVFHLSITTVTAELCS